MSPFRLTDPTKPGHRRFIALWLVDPNVRIISTANVPPQQLNWWADSIFTRPNQSRSEVLSKLPTELVQLLDQKGVNIGSSKIEKGRLPPELNDMLRKHFETEEALLMSEEEAREHRERLMNARSTFQFEADDKWQEHTYSFCEH